MLKDIFSIQDYGETHHMVRLFGLKIKFPKKEFGQKRKENPYYYYKKNNVDITTIPPATGQIRDIQLANLALLKELDYVCKQNGLTYWLDFGTLLGAVRHKGYIPWDDDIDVSMMREDYEKIIEAFKKSSRNPDIYAGYIRSKKNPCQYYIKVRHKKCPHLFVDIFPYNNYGDILSEKEQLEQTNVIKSIRNEMKKECSKRKVSDEEVLDIIKAGNEKVIKKDKLVEHSDLVWGLDFNHAWRNWFYSYDNIFPLKTIEFEGEEFSCVNDEKEHLRIIFGNYMDYPKKIGVGHSMFAKLKDEEKIEMQKLKG